jgi:hypothetical protein
MVFFTDKQVKPRAFKGNKVLREIGSIRNKSTSLSFVLQRANNMVKGICDERLHYTALIHLRLIDYWYRFNRHSRGPSGRPL